MLHQLTDDAQRADQLINQGRALLVRAVRQAAAAGHTQVDIAFHIGRSQPEVSRLLHFHGTSARARVLRTHAREVKRLIAERGGSNVRVFGSLATEKDHENSDIDLLFTMSTPLSLMELGALEAAISALLETPVDLVPDSALRPDIKLRVLDEAIPL